MKLSTFIILILLCAGGWYLSTTPLGAWIGSSIRNSFHDKPDPKTSLDDMAKKLPRTLHTGETVSEVSTYIQQRDDPFNPILGYLTFVGFSRYEYVFTWDTDHWVFAQMMIRDTSDIAHDITNLPVGMEIMNGPGMARFLYPYKYPPAPGATAQNAPAAPGATAIVPVAPRRTPTPQEQAMDIARKYGSSR
ncbi:hypothetical protein CfE428DRAFT_6104 [Chthoniobacter flavus Ellin428]|uniref:Uncharacterized protein n=1 Tax=Chthoniobacter flavus Ellin428 TaxID=497964 RepID=B4DB13_9BACT|nr:hypothetical protein [Chthoniobacter flavus]EDY16387.1 hypothetical protein CfE428DRAFT_6104 [Chthoniobacter flavus Ellin428]TCO92476.1 hypothetical protein EV701_106245 [Chthoniobacter flavus]